MAQYPRSCRWPADGLLIPQQGVVGRIMSRILYLCRLGAWRIVSMACVSRWVGVNPFIYSVQHTLYTLQFGVVAVLFLPPAMGIGDGTAIL